PTPLDAPVTTTPRPRNDRLIVKQDAYACRRRTAAAFAPPERGGTSPSGGWCVNSGPAPAPEAGGRKPGAGADQADASPGAAGPGTRSPDAPARRWCCP